MAITRKPKPQSENETISNIDVTALINRGGSVAASEPMQSALTTTRTTATVNLRIPARIVEQIDRSLETRPLKTPRHTWLLEAVLEKLEREGSA